MFSSGSSTMMIDQQQPQQLKQQHTRPSTSYITSDGKSSYFFDDNELFLFECATGYRLTTWCFVDNQREMMVKTVSEFKHDGIIYLLAAVSDGHSSQLKLLDCQIGGTLLSIEIQGVISFIRQLDNNSSVAVTASSCSTPDFVSRLRCPVAIGTQSSAQTILIDLCFNRIIFNNNSNSINNRTTSIGSVHSLFQLDPATYDANQFWQQANNSTLIPSVVLPQSGEVEHGNNPSFRYPVDAQTQGLVVNARDPHSHVQTSRMANVSVTAIAYFQPLNTLAVGYSNGCFQLFSSETLRPVYSSALKDYRSPVTQFLFQDLEDDAAGCMAYLWVGRDHLAPSIVLYKLIFSNSSAVASKSMGSLQDVENLHLDVVTSASERESAEQTGKLLYMGYLHENHNISEDASLPRSVSIFVFRLDDSPRSSSLHISIFDLNTFERVDNNPSFRNRYLIHLTDTSINCSFNAFWLNQTSVSRRIFEEKEENAPLLAIDHPSFSMTLLTDVSICTYDYQNPQERAIGLMAKGGSPVFAAPQQLYQRFLDVGIFTTAKSDPVQQRNDLILFALDNNLFSLVIDYVQDSQQSRDIEGIIQVKYFLVNPKPVLELAWDYFVKLDNGYDVVEVFTSTAADNASARLQIKLESTYVRMLDVFAVFECLCERYMAESKTKQVTPHLQSKYDAVRMSIQYLEIIKWASSKGLFRQDVIARMELMPSKVTANERQQLRETMAASNLRPAAGDIQTDDGLLIDILYQRLNLNESYPPTSSLQLKHFFDLFKNPAMKINRLIEIVYYILLDLTVVDIVPYEVLQSFESTFYLSPWSTNFVQGIWELDSAPLMEGDVMVSMHTSLHHLNHSKKAKRYAYHILSRFYIYKAHRCAIMFMKSIGFEPKDIKEAVLAMRILLANGCLVEAFLLERAFRSRFPTLPLTQTEQLATLLFDHCKKERKLDKVMEMHLDDFEDQCFVHYLYTINAAALVPLYMVRRGRIAEGCSVQHQLGSAAGFDSIRHFIGSVEQSLPKQQQFSDRESQQQQQQQSSAAEDIPDLPRSVMRMQQRQQQQQQPQQQQAKSFMYPPRILEKPITKLYNDTLDFAAKGLDTDTFRGFEIPNVQMKDYPPAPPYEEEMDYQQHQQQQQQQQQQLHEQMEDDDNITLDTDMVYNPPADSYMDYIMPLADTVAHAESQHVDEPAQFRTPPNDSDEEQDRSSSITSQDDSNGTSSPIIMRPLKSAMKVQGTPSKKKNVNFQEDNNSIRWIEALEKKEVEDYGEDEYEEEDDFDGEEGEEDEDDDTYNIGSGYNYSNNMQMMDDFDDDNSEEDEDAVYDEDDDMIIHNDVPNEPPSYLKKIWSSGSDEEEEEAEEDDDDIGYDQDGGYGGSDDQELLTNGTEDQPISLDSDDDDDTSAKPMTTAPPSQAQKKPALRFKDDFEDDDEDSDFEDYDEDEEPVEPLVMTSEEEDEEEEQRVTSRVKEIEEDEDMGQQQQQQGGDGGEHEGDTEQEEEEEEGVEKGQTLELHYDEEPSPDSSQPKILNIVTEMPPDVKPEDNNEEHEADQDTDEQVEDEVEATEQTAKRVTEMDESGDAGDEPAAKQEDDPEQEQEESSTPSTEEEEDEQEEDEQDRPKASTKGKRKKKVRASRGQ
ncbi:hypothetical protein SAMD00019534_063260 [Acytostelium subglobosum LB1]|uniref:hypothetical protein n=1 Tax=Acytostelium subglobosum LB1 TaxID=1410327 RepID=UPI0006450BF4|nr:hypothetical protein SAMD00019534_063260 [Acytostelium subglobosum LB1]GAM23151.1 hypothetical protein SAMD00019534_063260 [Acytostelium subglobosum LB1]|eukprot:XP_012753600.1 hypothetical protein SAMD00019534_063260 [Acytostelium subglobosum LB1]